MSPLLDINLHPYLLWQNSDGSTLYTVPGIWEQLLLLYFVACFFFFFWLRWVFVAGQGLLLLQCLGLADPQVIGILVSCPGIKTTSPALQGGFSTTGPLGKSP